MAGWLYWVNSEKSLSTTLLRSPCQVDLSVYTPRSLFLLHCYDHNHIMNLLTKFQAFLFYKIFSITMARWSYWVHTEHSISTALLRSQWQVDLSESTPGILFLLHYYDQNATMILLTKHRAFCFYCGVTIKMARWPHWLKFELSISTALLRSQCQYDLLSKLRSFSFYCIGMNTMPRCSHCIKFRHSVSNTLLPPQCHDELSD
jgi:hypothetical protein